MQIVTGYKGTAEIRLAAESGEVAGGCWQWESIKVTWRKALESGEVAVVLQVTPKAHPELPQVPVARNLAKTEEARLLLQAGVQDPGALSRLYAVPPATPRDRLQTLRSAFLATMRDPEFLAEAQKAKLDLDPLGGEELERIVHGMFGLDPSLIAKLKGILK
jgi:tripartite-type tricarboxylate transporter receptor subunit TctC